LPSPSSSSSSKEDYAGEDKYSVGSGGAVGVVADASDGARGDDANAENEDEVDDGFDRSSDPTAAAAAAAEAEAAAVAAAAEEAEEAAAIAATIAASEAQAATEAAADAMMGASVPGVPVGASGDDDEKAADGELSGSSAASRWNPLSYSHFLLRWLLSA